ncbi:LamG-like jellyroll fold domain-containing protein [Microbulbifer sp. SAOS-129_SWC]|uniref:LamG-like jellyroll fold domain-containing protein n=1 Tax=Microbulbifer sp. SAOS-129_SWC TaxID=3145235 RepID=UPI0032162E8A
MQIIRMLSYMLLLCSCGLVLPGCKGSGSDTPPAAESQDNGAAGNGSQDGNDQGNDQGGGDADAGSYPPTVDASAIAYNDMAVHDPSVIRTDDGTYYVFGSHLSAAKSTDLMTWQRVAEGVDDNNPLFNTYASEISAGIDWVGGYEGSWAPDVIRLKDGRYYFYYDHCTNPATGECDQPRSYLGVAVSDNIEGPYNDLGIFLRSGMTDEEIAQGYGPAGVTHYDPTVQPNAIDPNVFHDKDGNLWMTYGSYSGGIFVLQMDEDTGMPKPGQGYGTHVAGGQHSAIEGSYMLYSPDSDYYYLFMSFGGFVSTDGYNMRVARSHNPDGPFLDAEGNDMAAAKGSWESIAPYGVKLMGGFNFASDAGDPVPSRGYLSPGHNSAYYNADTGEYYVIFHTRFPNRGEEHAVRVHEMFINADGWPVVSPQRYAPIAGDKHVEPEDLVGDYKFIPHGKDINRTAKKTRYIRLNSDGTVSGEVSGTYTLFDDDPQRIDLALAIDGKEKTYRGVTQWQWNNGARALVPVFTALDGEGESIWGSRMATRSTGDVLADIAADLTVPEVARGGSLDLPQRGTRGATIDWSSSDTTVVTGSGRVTRPNVGSGDASATLTATIALNGQQLQQTFTVEVPQRLPYNRSAHYAFDDDLSDRLGRFADATATGDRLWSSGSIDYNGGHDGDALQLNGSNGVRLPDGLIDNNEYTVSFWANPTAVSAYSAAFFGAVDEQLDDNGMPYSNRWISFQPQGWDGNTMLWSGSEQWFDGTTGAQIPAGSWTHMAFSVDRGQVSVYLNGVKKFTGGTLPDFFTGASGVFALGVNYWDTPYNGLIDDLKVYDSALSAEEIQDLDITPKSSAELLTSAAEQLDLGDISAVREDLFLPISGAYASAIHWTSSDPAVIRVDGETGSVTQPQGSDAQVTLTATISLDGAEQSKRFTATVKTQGPPNPIATFSFEDSLGDSSGGFGAGSVVGTAIDQSGGSVSYAAGVVGKALVLDGNSGVRLPDDLITDNSYSFTLWLNPAALNAYTTSFFGWATTDSWISLLPNGFGTDTMLWSGSDLGTGWYDGHTGEQVATDTWSQLAVVVNNGDVKVYVNGQMKFSGTNFPDVFAPVANTHFALGVNYWDTPYKGMLDELKIYDEAMTAEDVTARFDEELLGSQ